MLPYWPGTLLLFTLAPFTGQEAPTVGKQRLEAFSDGVLAIIITIMVLELRTPAGHGWAALLKLWPTFLAYGISFLYIGIYWNNHHHLLLAVTRVNGTVLWANLHLLFWLSLLPFVSGWAGESGFAAVPMTVYALDTMLCGLAYLLLTRALIRADERNHLLAEAVQSDVKGKGSVLAYMAAVALPFLGGAGVVLSGLLLAGVALMWLIPDRRIERILEHAQDEPA